MQKFRALVSTLFTGLVFFLTTPAFSQVLWESLPSAPFNFQKCDVVFFSVQLGVKEGAASVTNLIAKKAGNNAKVTFVQDPDKMLDAMKESRLWVHITLMPTKNPELHMLNFSAKMGAETHISKEFISSVVWSKLFLLSGKTAEETDFLSPLDKTLSSFLSEFFSTNPQAKGKAIFYYTL